MYHQNIQLRQAQDFPRVYIYTTYYNSIDSDLIANRGSCPPDESLVPFERRRSSMTRATHSVLSKT